MVIHSSTPLFAARQCPPASWTCLDKQRKVTGHQGQRKGSHCDCNGVFDQRRRAFSNLSLFLSRFNFWFYSPVCCDTKGLRRGFFPPLCNLTRIPNVYWCQYKATLVSHTLLKQYSDDRRGHGRTEGDDLGTALFCNIQPARFLLVFVLQDLGVRIPRPLGNGPSRFIPEKEVWRSLQSQQRRSTRSQILMRNDALIYCVFFSIRF